MNEINLMTPVINADFNIPSLKSTRMLQCFTYIPKDDSIICGYKEINGSNERYCDLVKYNLTSKMKFKTYENLELWHCNDMTYNPRTNELIIIPMLDPRGNNYIYKYDYNTMTRKSQSPYINNSYLVGVAYDSVNDKYVLVGGGNSKDTLGVIINNSNFVYEKSFIIPKSGRTFQSVEVYNNAVFIYFNHEVEVRDYNGRLITTYKFSTTGESEGICHVGNGKFLVGVLDNSSASKMSASSRLYNFNVLKEKDMRKYYVVSDYIPQGEYGFNVMDLIRKYFYDIDHLYVRQNPTGMWVETQYLPYEKCLEIKQRLGNLFWTIKID